jgi:hypothetical protein
MSTLHKYPRTPHLPWSPGATNDDRVLTARELETIKQLPEFLVTEKMDGGNLTFYRDAFHGRSLDSGTHAWDTRARALWADIRFDIPEGWRISGESMYARRSVAYDELPGVYMVFGMWNERNELLDWDTTQEWAALLGLPTVPVIYRGSDFQEAITAWERSHEETTSEGFVLRSPGSFSYAAFGQHMGKWVRANHVRTAANWRHRDDFELNTFA